jgi:phosphate transport system substrate-binding protein
MKVRQRSLALFCAVLALTSWTGCGGSSGAPTSRIEIDGSSTVAPISAAVAEEFFKTHPNVNITVATAGTGGGMKRFVKGELDIADASRLISAKEKEECQKAGIEYVELEIAKDGLAVVVHPQNTWVECVTMAQLKTMWQPESTVKTWKDVNPEWPDAGLNLFGPGAESGTYDYFTGVVNGKEKACRKEFTASEDDNALVSGIQQDKNGLGYFGYAYYAENKNRLKLVAIDAGKGCVTASDATVIDGTYPLARPLFIYVNKASLKRPEVAEFLKFYLDNAQRLVKEVKYVPIDVAPAQSTLKAALDSLKKG